MSLQEMKPSFRERDPVFYLLLGLLSATRSFTAVLGSAREDPARRWRHRDGIRRDYDQILMAALGVVSLGRSVQRLFDEDGAPEPGTSASEDSDASSLDGVLR